MKQHRQAGGVGPAGAIHQVQHRDLGTLAPGTVEGPGLLWRVANWIRYRRRDVPKLLIGTLPGVLTAEATLTGRVYRADWANLAPWQVQRLRELLASPFDARLLPALFGGQAIDFGVLSTRVVTTAGVNALVDAFQGTVEPENFRYHGYGTGTNAEATGDTALQTELSTAYATDNTRPTGSQGEGASANVYRTTGTLAPDSTVAITEHGIFSQAATGGGTLLDRSVFSAVNLTGSVDSLQTQYDLTVTAGG